MQRRMILQVIVFLLLTGSLSAQLTEKQAYRLSQMPLECITQEWPNKTSHMSDGPADHRLLPSELHPAFYGCLDWHSSVHGHWLLSFTLYLKNVDFYTICVFLH